MAEFDSSITAYFGGDTSGLSGAINESEQKIAAFQSRVAESMAAQGVTWSEAPKKLAEESAKAYDEIFAAERKVADYQKQVTFDRMSNEGKLKMLQVEATALREQELAIEGNSVEKQSLKLQYQQKLTQIYDVNQKIQQEATKEEGSQTQQTSEHVKQLGAVGAQVEKVKKGFKEMGIELKGAGLGIIFATIVRLGKEAIANAQKQRDEYEQMKKPLDANTRALANFGDGIASIGKGLVNAVGFVLSGWNLIGESIGTIINRMKGVSEAQENYNEASQRAADIAVERAKQLKMQQHDEAAIAAEKKTILDQEKSMQMTRATEEQKYVLLVKEGLDLKRRQGNTERDTLAWYQYREKLEQNALAQEQQRYALVKLAADVELNRVQAIGSLDVTTTEKINTLNKERNVLEIELAGLQKNSNDYRAVQQKLLDKNVEAEKLFRDEIDASLLPLEQRAEWERIILGVSKLTVDQQHEFVATAEIQSQIAQRNGAIKTLELKMSQGLTAEEEARLKKLYAERNELETQLTKLQAMISPQQRIKDLAQQWNQISLDQLDAMAVQIKSALEMATAEGQVTSELQAQLDLVLRIANAKRNGGKTDKEVIGVQGADVAGFVQGESSAALKGTIQKLSNQLNSVTPTGQLLKNADINGNYGDYLTANLLRYQLETAQKEMQLRQTVSGYSQRYGESAARAQYGDTVVERALRDVQDTQTRTAQAVENISKQLTGSGLFPGSTGGGG